MRIDDFIKEVERIAPLELQEEWDNSGIQIRASNGEIRRVLVVLEINDGVIDEAIGAGADLILTHHPLIFGSLKKVDGNEITGNHIVKLIKRGISVYSTHTPFDKCIGGNNDYLGRILGIEDIGALPGDDTCICRMGTLGRPMTCAAFAEHASLALGIEKQFFNFAGIPDEIVSKIGWCTGSGAEFLDLAVAAGCDLFLTGDVKYHTAQHARDLGMNVLDCGHFGTEYIFCENMAMLLDKIPNLDIMQSRVNLNPFAQI